MRDLDPCQEGTEKIGQRDKTNPLPAVVTPLSLLSPYEAIVAVRSFRRQTPALRGVSELFR